MYITEVPIDEFLEHALDASVACEYPGLLVLIARSADAAEVQDELIRNWESLDDLTFDHIAVITPAHPEITRARADRRTSGVMHDSAVATLVSKGLWIDERHSDPDREWSRAFWHGTRDPRYSGENNPGPLYDFNLRNLGAGHVAAEPDSRRERMSAITAAATLTSRFFGVPEALVPCLVFVSMWERTLIILSVRESPISTYQLVRAVVVQHESKFELVRSLRTQLTPIQRGLGSIQSQIDRINNATESNSEYLTAVLKRLITLSKDHSIECVQVAREVADWLAGYEIDGDGLQKVDSLIGLLTTELQTKASNRAANVTKLISRLPTAANMRLTMTPQARELELSRLGEERAELSAEASKLLREVENVKRSTSLSDAVLHSVSAYGFVMQEWTVAKSQALANWRTVALVPGSLATGREHASMVMETRMRPVWEERLQALSKNVRTDGMLLQRYETALRTETDPARQMFDEEQIARLKQSMADHRRESEQLALELAAGSDHPMPSSLKQQLDQLRGQLGDIATGQDEIRNFLRSMRGELIERYDSSQRAVIAEFSGQLDLAQLRVVEGVLDALDAAQPPDAESQEIAKQLVNAIDRLGELGLLTPGQQAARQVMSGASLDVKHKLKIAVPILPFVMSYEVELGVGTTANLRRLWKKLLDRTSDADAQRLGTGPAD